MRRPTALVRAVSPSIGACELTHLDRAPIDLARARSQHAGYVARLAELGCPIETVEPAPGMPDAVFVEDLAVVVPELAIVTRPGADSRRGEAPGVATALQHHRPVRTIEAPGTLDGGDVLRIDRCVFVGASERTNAEGLRQLAACLEPLGYQIRRVPVTRCLHLKSAVTALPGGRLLMNPRWLSPGAFTGFAWIEAAPEEPFGANALELGDVVVYPAAFPRTRARLEAAGLTVHTVDVSEIAKAEGAVTCCSVLV